MKARGEEAERRKMLEGELAEQGERLKKAQAEELALRRQKGELEQKAEELELTVQRKMDDGTWPCVEVRDVIEEVKSKRIEIGFEIGEYNQRGVVCRGKGGKQEWDLAQKYGDYAEKVRTGWPRTASVLDGLAKHYECEARRWDQEAEREEYE